MTKINKTAARKLWNEGKEFTIVPCNMRPEHGVIVPAEWRKSTPYHDFDQFIDRYTYYNCVNAETGRYPAYYVKD